VTDLIAKSANPLKARHLSDAHGRLSRSSHVYTYISIYCQFNPVS